MSLLESGPESNVRKRNREAGEPDEDLPSQFSRPALRADAPRIDLKFPGQVVATEREKRRWFHWPLVAAGRLAAEALTQGLWTITDTLAWRPFHTQPPEAVAMRNVLCLELLSPVPGYLAALVEHVQAVTHPYSSTWNEASLCLLEAEKRRNRLLTWLTLSRVGVSFRVAALLTEAMYFCILGATYLAAPTFCNALVAHLDDRTLQCYLSMFDSVDGGKLLPWGSSFVPEALCHMWGFQDYTEVRELLDVMVAGIVGEVKDPLQECETPDAQLREASQRGPDNSSTLKGRLLELPSSMEEDMTYDTPLARNGSTSSGKAQRLRTVPEVEPTKAHDSGQGKSGFGGEKRLKSPDRLMKAMDQLWGSY